MNKHFQKQNHVWVKLKNNMGEYTLKNINETIFYLHIINLTNLNYFVIKIKKYCLLLEYIKLQNKIPGIEKCV